MPAVAPIYILWDSAHIWGLMAWRAVRALGLPCRLVKGQEIAEGAFLRKPEPGGAALLLVPGGNARLKAQALGPQGLDAVRRWVAQGGRYLGFCGGAGLALRHESDRAGLNLCPWARAAYPQRLHHLISGHVRVRLRVDDPRVPPELAAGAPDSGLDGATAAAPLATHGHGPKPAAARFAAPPCATTAAPAAAPALPVWWPGRFAPEEGADVRVLAAYDAPGEDFWLADLPLRRIPAQVFEAWQVLYGVNLSADFLAGQPLVAGGAYGEGSYILSYSHLETPRSPAANAWLAHLLRQAGYAPKGALVPLWQLRAPCAAWPAASGAPLLRALNHMRGLLDLAVEHHLFFARTHWLWGWRAGQPGAACNNLHAALCTAAGLPPTPEALAYWTSVRPRFAALEELFTAGAEGYFLACRLADTLAPTLPEAVGKRGLEHQREALFGHPMSGGGLLEELLTIAEELVYLSQGSPPQ
ncbi:BPL-N domain-containing protein [Desulfovibrio legallii]|uniref:Biotin-protein ligase, N terminal n=1 Tax=Desulfovibrio legallii TaxID=571438 RepID=A0A1G7P168_9BACT|nr:BPL-N domain-containing protein [Desulfovibrio legallii]SDF79170.1 Biotin-protein ligase, N terminal [Desulfovibrio legallii]